MGRVKDDDGFHDVALVENMNNESVRALCQCGWRAWCGWRPSRGAPARQRHEKVPFTWYGWRRFLVGMTPDKLTVYTESGTPVCCRWFKMRKQLQ